MKEIIQDKMLGELGMGKKKQEAPPQPRPLSFNRTFRDGPALRQDSGRKPLPKTKVYESHRDLVKLDYTKFPPKSRQEYFSAWVERVGWKWSDVCSANETPYYAEIRDYFLSKKLELFK